MCPIKRTCNFYRQCPVIAEASDFPRTFPNMSKRSFSLTLIGAYFSLSEIRKTAPFFVKIVCQDYLI